MIYMRLSNVDRINKIPLVKRRQYIYFEIIGFKVVFLCVSSNQNKTNTNKGNRP